MHDSTSEYLQNPGVNPPRIPKRRIPGTLALAATNLTAAFLLVNPETFISSPVHQYAIQLIPPVMLGWLFVGSATLLLLATVVRRWPVFNVGAGISMFVWTFLCVSAMASSFRGGVSLSPVAIALFVWMLAGQAAMLFAPLTVERFEGER